jgi:hypothetical protein
MGKASAATATGLQQLFDAMQFSESSNNPNAVSKKGAKGLMQVMPNTAKDPGYWTDPLPANATPEQNRKFGEQYMTGLMRYFNGDVDTALRAYNWGPGNVKKWIKAGSDPKKLPKETRDYVTKIRKQLTPAPVGQPVIPVDASGIMSLFKRKELLPLTDPNGLTEAARQLKLSGGAGADTVEDNTMADQNGIYDIIKRAIAPLIQKTERSIKAINPPVSQPGGHPGQPVSNLPPQAIEALLQQRQRPGRGRQVRGPMIDVNPNTQDGFLGDPGKGRYMERGDAKMKSDMAAGRKSMGTRVADWLEDRRREGAEARKNDPWLGGRGGEGVEALLPGAAPQLTREQQAPTHNRLPPEAEKSWWESLSPDQASKMQNLGMALAGGRSIFSKNFGKNATDILGKARAADKSDASAKAAALLKASEASSKKTTANAAMLKALKSGELTMDEVIKLAGESIDPLVASIMEPEAYAELLNQRTQAFLTAGKSTGEKAISMKIKPQ